MPSSSTLSQFQAHKFPEHSKLIDFRAELNQEIESCRTLHSLDYYFQMTTRVSRKGVDIMATSQSSSIAKIS